MNIQEIGPRFYAILACIIALILGIIYISFFPQFRLPIDALEYDTLGWNLTQGNGYQIERGEPDITREPAYPIFLSFIYSIFGHRYSVVRLIQVVINALTCLIVYFIGKDIFGAKVGVIAALIVSIYPAFIVYTGHILTETLFTFLLAVSIFTLIKAIKQGLLRWYIITGLILGLAILCKAALIVFPFVASGLILIILKENKKKVLYVFCMIFAVLLTMLPWTVRNYKVFHAVIPIRTGSGFNLWFGSYLPWEGKNLAGEGGYPEIRIKFIGTEPLKSLVKGLTPVEADKVLMQESIKNIKNNSAGYIKLSLKRIPRLWIHPIGEGLIRERSKFLSVVLVMLHYILLLLSLVGMVLALRNFKIFILALPMTLVVIYFTVIYSVTYAHPRYHFPVLAYVILFSSSGLVSLFELFGRRQY